MPSSRGALGLTTSDKRLPDCEGIETNVMQTVASKQYTDKRLPDCEGIETVDAAFSADVALRRQEAARL